MTIKEAYKYLGLEYDPNEDELSQKIRGMTALLNRIEDRLDERVISKRAEV